jgi:nitrogen regulatory protein PII 1
MKAITAVIRPEKEHQVVTALEEAGYFAFTKWAVTGRGREKGIQVGDVLYREMARIMIYMVVENDEKDQVVDVIIHAAKTGETGAYGDGKIFVSDVKEAYTISTEAAKEMGQGF